MSDVLLSIPNTLFEVLRSLVRAGAATATQLEVQTGRIGDPLERELSELRELGLVESAPMSRGLDKELFFPSPRGRDLVR